MEMETRPTVIVIAGANGSGKSTTAPRLLRDYLLTMEFVNADVIAQGLSAFQPENVAIEAGRIMLKRLQELAEKRQSFAFETTLAARSFAPFLRRLQQEGYHVHLLFLWLSSPEMAVARVALRVAQGGHAIPENVVRRRYEAGLRNFFTLYRPLTNSWEFLDAEDIKKCVAFCGKDSESETVIQYPKIWNQLCQEYEK